MCCLLLLAHPKRLKGGSGGALKSRHLEMEEYRGVGKANF